MANGRVQINGVTFETDEAQDGFTAGKLAERLIARGGLQRVSVEATSGRVQLIVNPDAVWAVAAWVASESSPTAPPSA